MRRRQVWAEASKILEYSPIPASMMAEMVERWAVPEMPPGDDALPEPKRKAGWPKGRKRK